MALHIYGVSLQQRLEVLAWLKRAHEENEIPEDPEALQYSANDLDIALGVIDLPVCRMDHANPLFGYGKVVNEVLFGLHRNRDDTVGIERGVQRALETVQPIGFGM